MQSLDRIAEFSQGLAMGRRIQTRYQRTGIVQTIGTCRLSDLVSLTDSQTGKVVQEYVLYMYVPWPMIAFGVQEKN